MTTNPPHLSRYLRTTHLFRAKNALSLPDGTQIRFFTQGEAQELTELVRRRNVFARHSRENNFYLQRIEALADKPVIELLRPGDPDDMLDQAAWAAEWAEKTVFLSATLAIQRKQLYKLIGVGVSWPTAFDLTIGRGFRYLRSKSRRQHQGDGILIDSTFVNRFNRCGFPALHSVCVDNTGMSDRMRLVVGWLYESHQEPHLPAALVKTAIALESLLIFSESESLAKTLAERAAFILSPDPAVRETIARIVKQFYEARSGVVHGSQKKARKLTLHLVEGMDRLALLLCLVIARNISQWSSKEALQSWCEKERWGSPSSSVQMPVSPSYLKKAINICLKGVGVAN